MVQVVLKGRTYQFKNGRPIGKTKSYEGTEEYKEARRLAREE